MPTKAFGEDGTCRVEFRLPPESGHTEAWVVGEFNDWQLDATPMEPQGDGSLAVEVALEPGRSYRFRYYLGGERWENDWAADAYVDNEFGGADSVVTVPEASSAPTDPGSTGGGPGFQQAVATDLEERGGPPPTGDPDDAKKG
jgi:1,4-alpha-glucan branching enzyme